MPKSTSRRISLQPVFEPFDLVESTPLMMPSPSTNGFFHSETLDDEDGGSSNGYHGEQRRGEQHTVEPNRVEQNHADQNRAEPIRGEKNGVPVNGVPVNGAPLNGTASNGNASAVTTANAATNGHGAVANGFVVHSESATNGIYNGVPSIAVNGAPAFALNGAVNRLPARIADASDADSDPADLAATSEVLCAVPSESVSTENDTATRNGHSHLNGDAKLNGNSEVKNVAVNGSAAKVHSDHVPEIVARAPVSSEPPAVDVEPAQASVESAANASSAPSPGFTTREPHPASGSLFVPYLVTEIRELRDRRQRRRSWWRRLFG